METDFEPSLAMNHILTILKDQTGMQSRAFFMTGCERSAQRSVFSKYFGQ